MGRLTARRQCRGCGRIYNVMGEMPSVADVCDSCGGEVYQRDDDTVEAATKRLNDYDAVYVSARTLTTPRRACFMRSTATGPSMSCSPTFAKPWRRSRLVIVRKSAAEIETMREAGRVSARALRLVGEAVRPGVTTTSSTNWPRSVIREEGGVPAFKGYHGFPKTLCTSVGCQVVHGIPSSLVTLLEGQILSVDVGAIVDGYYGDNARTFAVGEISRRMRRDFSTLRRPRSARGSLHPWQATISSTSAPRSRA